MLKILAIAVAIVAVAIIGVLAYATTRPDSFRIARSTSIKASPEKIFPLINDLQAMKGWSPYEKKDPAMQRSFSGPAAGVGAKYAWAGDKNIGEGRMEIVESKPNEKIAIRLEFLKPFEATHMAEFTLQPGNDGSTTVTWAMIGAVKYVFKIVHIFFNADAMVGKDFEAGLVDLKAMAEK
jgi:uncharacterized protein YndB with AHSA1/START domain